MYRKAILKILSKSDEKWQSYSAYEKASRADDDDRQHYDYNTPLCQGVKNEANATNRHTKFFILQSSRSRLK